MEIVRAAQRARKEESPDSQTDKRSADDPTTKKKQKTLIPPFFSPENACIIRDHNSPLTILTGQGKDGVMECVPAMPVIRLLIVIVSLPCLSRERLNV